MIHLPQNALDVGGYTTAGFSSGTEAFASDIEGGTVKKEKKKKKVKNKDLLHRDKAHPDKLKSKWHQHSLHDSMHYTTYCIALNFQATLFLLLKSRILIKYQVLSMHAIQNTSKILRVLCTFISIQDGRRPPRSFSSATPTAPDEP